MLPELLLAMPSHRSGDVERVHDAVNGPLEHRGLIRGHCRAIAELAGRASGEIVIAFAARWFEDQDAFLRADPVQAFRVTRPSSSMKSTQSPRLSD